MYIVDELCRTSFLFPLRRCINLKEGLVYKCLLYTHITLVVWSLNIPHDTIQYTCLKLQNHTIEALIYTSKSEQTIVEPNTYAKHKRTHTCL